MLEKDFQAKVIKYLKSKGVNINAMSDQEIKEANTADQVFLAIECKILDAIEDLKFKITMA